MGITPFDLMRIDYRLVALENEQCNSKYEKRKLAIFKQFSDFVFKTKMCDISLATSFDIRRFLVFKDREGKTVVHRVSCRLIGTRKPNCKCPRRLAFGTVKSLVAQLSAIFRTRALPNLAITEEVKSYIKCVKLEQARGHSLVHQAVPVFKDKLSRMSQFIDRQLLDERLVLKQRFLFLRDQAFFKVQFFAGDRAGDLCLMLAQEIKLGRGGSLMISHTAGKTLRGGQTNTFSLPRCEEDMICPVRGLHRFVSESLDMGVSLGAGYLFRPVTKSGMVLDRSVSYDIMYRRFKYYLHALGMDEGETLHGFRAGCAFSLVDSGVEAQGVMQHVGWKTENMFKRYSRSDFKVDLSASAVLAELDGGRAQKHFKEINVSGMEHAFMEF